MLLTPRGQLAAIPSVVLARHLIHQRPTRIHELGEGSRGPVRDQGVVQGQDVVVGRGGRRRQRERGAEGGGVGPGRAVAVLGGPEHDEAFEQRDAGAGDGLEEVEVGAADGIGRHVADGEAVLGCGDFEEGHLAPDVIER